MDDAGTDDYLQVSVDAAAHPPQVTAWGDLDAASAGQLAAALDSALAQGHGVTVELGDVAFIDSSGLRAVTVALRRAKDEGAPFRVASMSGAVRRVFEMTGVTSLLTD